MREAPQFYIDGQWVEPTAGATPHLVINPATEAPMGRIMLGTAADVDRAAKAAYTAFPAFSRTSRAERIELLESILAAFQDRIDDIAAAITEEMGAPSWLARQAQAAAGVQHFQTALDVLRDFRFEEWHGQTQVWKEPIGVCGLITPWNWPLNQIACKVAPALAVGCTMVLKPSEVAPFNAILFAEVLHAAGVPKGVFNLVNGDGPTVGAAISSHPLIDMVSFTGSTRAGIEVARSAAPTVKRVAQELGGKSPNILLPSADLDEAVARGVQSMMLNSGQSCNAPSRMFVPREKMEAAKRIAKAAADTITVGNPLGNHRLGPVVSELQFDKIQSLIHAGIAEGATLVAGGPGRPEGLDKGFYVRPTVFADVTNDMTIAREEIFGPVLTMLAYDDVEQAIRLGNDTPYGLAAYVQGEGEEAIAVARRLRAGQVNLNGAPGDRRAPFGGFKQSGNGREWGEFGFSEFLEIKAVLGGQLPDDHAA